ncbi:glycogen debranching N-terminal domain-containing protein [Vulgatibacter sp.]|uniref:amylo-alpha-1,6-glucosidase n=1 Tax=Vulgatibacter sp. TaxID=1971226 RepID=UPI00356334C4
MRQRAARRPGEPISGAELFGYDDPSLAGESTAVEKLTLKSGDHFAVTNRRGDIAPAGARDMGFFREDTRFLSYLELSVSGGPPVVLSTQTSTDYVTQIDMTVTTRAFGGIFLGDPVNFLHLRREQLVHEQFVDRYTLTNFVTHPIDFWLELAWAADFADVFEIRGMRREARGQYRVPEIQGDAVIARYLGRDGRRYRSEITLRGGPSEIEAQRARFDLHLEPNASAVVELRVAARFDDEPSVEHLPYEVQAESARGVYRTWRHACTSIETGDAYFDAGLAQSIADLRALQSERGGEPVIAAGIPWYTCPFGRDTLLTAYEAMPVAPQLARDALVYLAAHQGTKIDPERDEEPGKILHEVRTGEMARAGEIPHTPYYGTVDATPLWLILLSEYFLWTDDRSAVSELLPAAARALQWIDEWGDPDGDGFVEYEKKGARGLDNQGWKDSRDGVIFADGTVARGPIALVEVQGYVFDAKRRMAQLYRRFGIPEEATRLAAEAQAMAQRIDERFWMEEKGTYAEALDGEKRQVDAITSNPGHLLWCRAAVPERARRVGEVLLGRGMFSGWGIRTLASGQLAYNPLSYHNGTVWPHDNALCAMGLANYGMNGLAVEVLEGLYLASRHFRHHRLPELFCGLGRRQGDFPVHYPVACSPQAWSSAAFFLLLRACLGLQPDAPRRTLQIQNPRLPHWLEDVHVRGMQIGPGRVSLHFTRTGEGTFAAVSAMEGEPLRVRIDLAI